MTFRPLACALAALLVLPACSPPPAPQRAPAPRRAPAPPPTAAQAVPPEAERPPASGPAAPFTLPTPEWSALDNGLRWATIKSLSPLVHIRLVVPGGKATDGDKPGLSALAFDLLKAGGAGDMTGKQLLERLDALGAKLEVSTRLDQTVFSIAVTAAHWPAALDLLATAIKRPVMSPAEHKTLRKRWSGQAQARAREDGRWAARVMLHRSLFRSGGAIHPYSAYDATPAEIDKISAQDCRDHVHRLLVPKNIWLSIAGEVEHNATKLAVETALGDMRGGEPPAVSYPAPVLPPGLTITVVDRPGSAQSEVLAGVLGPDRTSGDWPSFAVGAEIFGGGETSRLAALVTAKIALVAESRLTELTHGPSMHIAYAVTPAETTALAVKALKDQLDRLGNTEPTDGEVRAASGALAAKTAIRLDGAGALADELVATRTLGLPDGEPALFLGKLPGVTPASVAKTFAAPPKGAALALVVAGDAKTVGPLLTPFGDVKIVDPTNNFVEKSALQKAPEKTDAPAREANP